MAANTSILYMFLGYGNMESPTGDLGD